MHYHFINIYKIFIHNAGNIELNGKSETSHIQINNSNDLHLNDHQTLDEIRRPMLNRTESINERHEELTKNLNSSKSVEYDEVETDPNAIESGLDYINQKFSSLHRSDSSRISRSDSEKSTTGHHEFSKSEVVNVVEAQVHCRKSSDSDT